MSQEGDSDAPEPPAGGPRDVALLQGLASDGSVRILRQRAERLEVGAIHPLREGAPIHGEIVRLTPRKEFPLLCDVESIFTPPSPPSAPKAASATRKGPVQVASDDYRRNWDAVWSRPPKDTLPS